MRNSSILAGAVATFFTACSGHAATKADYVIIGGGPAGVVLAESLSRDGTRKVLLLEAGKETFNSTLLNSQYFLSLYCCVVPNLDTTF
jgi:choline dehydrogenase